MKSQIPDYKVLISGIFGSKSNFMMYLRLVAQRIERFADNVGRDRVIAGIDCSFGAVAGLGKVDADIFYAKSKSMAEAAALASSGC